MTSATRPSPMKPSAICFVSFFGANCQTMNRVTALIAKSTPASSPTGSHRSFILFLPFGAPEVDQSGSVAPDAAHDPDQSSTAIHIAPRTPAALPAAFRRNPGGGGRRGRGGVGTVQHHPVGGDAPAGRAD